jgi:carboxymethylenebutenolidase
VPNLYHRVGGIKDIEDRTEVFGKAFGLDDRLIIQDVAAATAVLRGLPGASGKVGAIGFCAGGRQVLLVACSTDQLNAGIDCWGGGIHRASPTEDTTPLRPVKPIDLVQYLSCPLFVVIGATDQDPSPEIGQELWSRMQAHNKPGKLKVYPDAGHAFFADYRPAAYREAQAHELWNDALAFFEETLNR